MFICSPTKLALRINDIYTQLEKITETKEMLNGLELITNSQLHPSDHSSLSALDDENFESRNRQTSTTSDRDFKMIGRDGVKEDIFSKLQNGESKLLVVPIIGMGGMGKTTMSRSVFGDEVVRSQFKLMKWVFVGKSFDAMTLLKEGILEEPQFVGNLAQIHDKVIEKVKGNKFLIVLDDAWNDDQDQWGMLLTPLTRGGDGSRILVTTRNERVAKAACNNIAYHVKLEPLVYDRCVELFEKYAFPYGVPDEHSSFRKIGKEIVGKLQGHPLTIKVIGSSLCGETKESEWKKIRDSNSWGDNVTNENHFLNATIF